MTKRVKKSRDGKYRVRGKAYSKLVGSRAQVWHGTAYKTSGGLNKPNLLMNKHGRVVYYHKEQYKYLTPSQLKNANESVLPTNTKMQGYRVNTTVTNNSTLEEFIG